MNDEKIYNLLETLADLFFNGHFTVMKFTTNWKIGFYTATTREEIEDMATGSTFREAALTAVSRVIDVKE